MKNIKITVAFDGSRYKGWQKNKEADTSVEGKIEAVLAKMTGEEIVLVGCSRTDVGVHAENYIANFHTHTSFTMELISDYLYEFLPDDIVIKEIEEVEERFHARYNVKSKTYVFRINNSKYRNVFERKYEYHLEPKLNLMEMKKATGFLVGTHDFQSFTTQKPGAKSFVKTVNYIKITEDKENVEIEMNADDFLFNMARIIVSILLEVGKGEFNAKQVEKILENKHRAENLPIAQPKALFLKEVEY